jgi:hypothetical protein
MTVIKSERKNRKKGKKALKVQEVIESRSNFTSNPIRSQNQGEVDED